MEQDTVGRKKKYVFAVFSTVAIPRAKLTAEQKKCHGRTWNVVCQLLAA